MEDKEELECLTSVSVGLYSGAASSLCSGPGPGPGQFYHVQRPQPVLRVALTSTNLTHLDSVLHSNGDFKK